MQQQPMVTTNRSRGRVRAAAGGLLVMLLGAGCTSTLPVRAVRYDVSVRLDPAAHSLEGTTTVALAPVRAATGGPAAVELELHPDLEIDRVEVTGARLRSRSADPADQGEHPVPLPTRHRLIVDGVSGEMQVTMAYHGELAQDVDAGEKEGQIHNFAMSAHIGPEGVYLEESGRWYPRPAFDDDTDPAMKLADYTLVVDPIEGFEMVAGLERRPDPADDRLHWSSPFPLDGLVLLGGPLQRWTRQHGDVTLHAVLNPAKEMVARDILDASAEYLDKYQPLVGPYPFSEFTVLEAFFSSGFAFPTCTQIVGSQLTPRKQYRRHGYIDHELLHNWWGNGIFVDPQDGNWCEAFASYGGNYYGYVLEGDPEGARKQRRNQSNFLSAVKPEDDKPLGTFGQEEGAGRGIAYSKGAAVLHMLERRIGHDAFFAALRRLTRERMGSHINWSHIQDAFETEAGQDLDWFFKQWVRSGGAPRLELLEAEWTPGSDEVVVTISQGDTDFELDVPLRLFYGRRAVEVVVAVDEPVDRVVLACEPAGLTAVELDPDYHVFRKLKLTEVMPTSAMTRRAKKLTIVVPAGELAGPYQRVVDSFRKAVAGTEDKPKADGEVAVVSAVELNAEQLRGGSVLIVGDAARHEAVSALLVRAGCPVTWNDAGFAVQGSTYAAPGEAVFFTLHHPDDAAQGVTVYYGNSEAALANAGVLTFYPNSLLVFDTPPEDTAVPRHGMPAGHTFRTNVVRRMDFESHDRIEL